MKFISILFILIQQLLEALSHSNQITKEGVVIGSNGIVLPICHCRGRSARIVVTKDIPDYAVAVVSPARVVRSFGFAKERNVFFF